VSAATRADAIRAGIHELAKLFAEVDAEDVRVFMPAHDEMDWDRGQCARRYQEAVAQLRDEGDGRLGEWTH